jgi:hypothetical protein
MQGIEIGVQAVIAAGAQKQELMQTMESQVSVLAHCLTVCMTAWSGATQSTGTTVQYARALDDSRQLLGNIGYVAAGGPATKIDVLIAQDRAKQMAGNIEGKVALEFMNAPTAHSGGRGEASSELPLPPMPS